MFISGKEGMAATEREADWSELTAESLAEKHAAPGFPPIPFF
jgi:hypothetical protein